MPRATRKPDAPESKHQIVLVGWARKRGHDVFAVPNEGRRTARMALRLREQGLVPGQPDLVITHKDGRKPIAVEMKNQTGRPSPAQRERIQTLRAYGWEVLIAQGAYDGVQQLMRLGF